MKLCAPNSYMFEVWFEGLSRIIKYWGQMKIENPDETKTANEQTDESMTSTLFKRLGVSNKTSNSNLLGGVENIKKVAESRQDSFKMFDSNDFNDDIRKALTPRDSIVSGPIYDGAKWLSYWEEKDDSTIEENERNKLRFHEERRKLSSFQENQGSESDNEKKEEGDRIYAPAEYLKPQGENSVASKDSEISTKELGENSPSSPQNYHQLDDTLKSDAVGNEIEETKNATENP